ncbi:hypothetical protein ACLB2K_065366 [Fragaria x ananassa]
MFEILDSHIEPGFEIKKELFLRAGTEISVAHATSVVAPIPHTDAASALEILKEQLHMLWGQATTKQAKPRPHRETQERAFSTLCHFGALINLH